MKENYIEFENQFRGSRESILERLDQYKGILAYVKEEYPRAKTLDLGCGRGEWLEKCKQYELSAQGIDASNSMIKYCKEERLNACKGNIFKIMPHLKSNRYSLITAFHIIEHLENDKISKLLIEAERLLKNNGILIIEMPSIDNIYVSTDSFYLDETHINKIHPKLLTYKLGLNGFKSTEINYINGETEEDQTHLMKQLFYKVGQDVSIVASKKTKLPTGKSGNAITDSIIKYPAKREIIAEIDLSYENNIKLLHQVSRKIKEESAKREAQLQLQADQLQLKINGQADQLQLKINELSIKLELTEKELREKKQTIEKSMILRIERKAYRIANNNLENLKKLPSKIKAKIPNRIKIEAKLIIKNLSLKIYQSKIFRGWTTAAKQRRIIKGLRLIGIDWIAQTITQAIYEYKQKETNSNAQNLYNINNLRSIDMLLLKRSNSSKRYAEIKKDLKQGGSNK